MFKEFVKKAYCISGYYNIIENNNTQRKTNRSIITALSNATVKKPDTVKATILARSTTSAPPLSVKGPNT